MTQDKKDKGSVIGNINVSGGQVNIVAEGTINQVYNGGNTQISSVGDFIQLMGKINALVEKLDVDQDTKQAIQSDLRVIISQTEKKTPQKAVIITRIQSALELIISLGSAVTAGQTIYPLLQQAYEFAKARFVS